MPVFTRAYANLACAISRATANRPARGCTRCESGRSSSRKSGRSSSCESRRSNCNESRRTGSGESCRTGTTADGSRASGGTWGTGRARRDHYRYFKSCSRR